MIVELLHRLGRRGVRSRALVADSYLTNGRRLFRVVSWLTAGHEPMLVTLEDCVTLEVQAYAQSELHVMGLQPVRTSDAAKAASDVFSDTSKTVEAALMLTASRSGG